jgi:ABC-2 type transport system permease protein
MVSRKKKDLLRLITVIVAVILVNYLASGWFFRYDFTAEKRFSIAPVSRKMMADLDAPLHVAVYLDGDFPAGFQRLQHSVSYLLSTLRAYSNRHYLSFDFVNPVSGTQQQQEDIYKKLSGQGIEPIQVGVTREGGISRIMVYPAAMISYHGQQLAVNLLPSVTGMISQENLNGATENLEYAIMSGIKKVMTGGKPLIGISEGHGELSDIDLYDAMAALSSGFDVRRVNLAEVSAAGLQKMKLLIVAKPQKAFTEAEKYKIDYFVMNGGRVLWSVDNVHAELDSLRAKGSSITMPRQLNLDDLLFTYGIRINYELIADMNCAPIPIRMESIDGRGQMQLAPWLYFPVFVPQGKHPVVRNLQGIRSEFASPVDTIAVKGVNKEVILSSSPYSRIALSPATISLDMVRQEADPSQFKDRRLPFAIVLEGTFPSAFYGRPVPAGVLAAGQPVSRSRFTKMLVAGDGDLFRNQVNAADGSPFPLGYDRYSQQQYANKTFLLNSVDYLTDDTGLISLRNREISNRLLDRARIRESKVFWQAINIGLPLLAAVLAGVLQYVYRRHKFGSKGINIP